MSNGLPRDPDDYFAETRMSFGEHIEELRHYLWRAIYGFLIALFFSFFVGRYVMDWITAPVKHQLDRFYDRRAQKVMTEKKDDIAKFNKPTEFRRYFMLRAQIRDIARGIDPDPNGSGRRPVIQTAEQQEEEKNPPPWWKKWFLGGGEIGKSAFQDDYDGPTVKIPEESKDEHIVGIWMSIDKPLFTTADGASSLRELLQIDSPTTLRAEEAFFVWFKVCIVTGLVIGSPVIFWQIWMFVAAGLYPNEKRLVHVYLPVSLGLFLTGVAICELFVIPKALEALLWFNEWLGFKPDIRLNDWLGFAIFMPLVFGLSFQTPMVMLFLNRLGIMDAQTFGGKRSYAWFAMAIFAALVTPSVDAFSMLFLWLPMGLLYELGIFLIKLSPPPEVLPEDAAEADEMIEV